MSTFGPPIKFCDARRSQVKSPRGPDSNYRGQRVEWLYVVYRDSVAVVNGKRYELQVEASLCSKLKSTRRGKLRAVNDDCLRHSISKDRFTTDRLAIPLTDSGQQASSGVGQILPPAPGGDHTEPFISVLPNSPFSFGLLFKTSRQGIVPRAICLL